VKRTRLYRKSRLRRKGIVNKPYIPKHDPGRLAFRIAVLAKGGCVLAGREGHICSGPLDPHHVVEKATLRKRGLVSELWNPDNGIAVCRKAHDDHTTRFRPLPADVLPAEAHEFAARLGLTHLIDRIYPRPAEDTQPTKGTDLSAA
jgi:hypothetical protein